MPSTLSPLRYPGGKSRFYPYIREVLMSNDLLGETYIEPFAGGAGLALKLLFNNDVKRIVINDFDPAIYAVWHSVLNHPDELCHLVEEAVLTQEEWCRQRELYINRNLDDLLQLGFATLFLNRTNVSGVIQGGIIGGQQQHGNYKIDARFNKQTLVAKIKSIAERRDQIVILNEDAKMFLRPEHLRRFYKAFLYIDPPYVKKGAQLYKNAFIEQDHKELFQLVSGCKRKWVVTYDICSFIADLYQSYRSSYFDVTYSIQKSKQAQEYIFFSNNLILPPNIILR